MKEIQFLKFSGSNNQLKMDKVLSSHLCTYDGQVAIGKDVEGHSFGLS
jgi:hypothetical protein